MLLDSVYTFPMNNSKKKEYSVETLSNGYKSQNIKGIIIF